MRIRLAAQSPRPAIVALLGLLVFITALGGIALTNINGRIASIWFANAILLAALVRSSRGQWAAFILAAGVANVAADLAIGDDLVRAVALTACNLVEVLAVGLWAMRGGRRVQFDSSDGILSFLVAALATGPVLSAAMATLVLSPHVDRAAFDLFAGWYLSDALGLLVVTPLLVLGFDLRRPSARKLVHNLLWSGAVGAMTLLIFSQNSSLTFLLPPALVLATYRARLGGAMMALAALIAVAIGMTISGHGPIAATVADPLLRNYLLQAFVAAMVFMVLPVRALLGERDRLNLRVEEGERMFHRIAEASPAGILYLDPRGRATYANRRWGEITGAEPQIGVTDEWLSIFDPEGARHLRSAWTRAQIELRPCEVEVLLSARRSVWAQVSIFPEVQNGQVQGFVLRLADVTTRREAEAALHESEALYRLVTENSSDLVLRVGLDGSVRYASSAARRLLGKVPHDLVGQSLADLVSEPDRAAVEALLGSAADPTAPGEGQFRMLDARRDWRWIEASRRLVVDPEDGRPAELVVTLRDVDRRRRSELATIEALDRLRESHRLLAMSGRLGGVEPWRWDLASNRLELPSRLAEIIGVGGGQPLPKALGAWLAQIEPADRRVAARLFARARQDGRAHPTTIRIRRHDGSVRHLHVTAQLDRAADGVARSLVGVARDVSDEVRARLELVEARDAAEAGAAAKGNFLATMSHEIRTPLTGVIGMIDLLRAEPDGPERDLYLATLKQSADLLLAVLDDVLDFSKLESGGLTLESRDFDLDALTKASLSLFANAAASKGIALTLDNRCRPGTTAVRGDAIRLQQVLVNLLSNAVKFTERGAVSVALSGGGGDGSLRAFRLEVRDSGIGIAAEAIDGLFRPFAQAEASTSRRFGGTGLGLAIANGLVQAMGGRITANSIPGEGSCFAIDLTLPVASASPAAPQPATGADPDLVSLPMTVLVAEDNPVNQLLVGAYLRRQGHVVDCVGDGRQAVEAAAARAFDLIIMDMQMPEMDGLAATRAIRRGGGRNADTPIVALTADASPERRRFYDGAGLSAFLTKPIDEAALIETIAVLRDGAPSGVVAPAAPIEGVLALLDEARIAELGHALGEERVAQLLDLLADQCQLQSIRLDEQASRRDDKAIAATAHSIKGAAESVGALALGAAARVLETATEGAARDAALARLKGMAAATRVAILERACPPGRQSA